MNFYFFVRYLELENFNSKVNTIYQIAMGRRSLCAKLQK